MNNITIAGTLGRDAEVRYMPNGDAVAGFSVADNQGKDKPTIWWSCSLFGKRAESLSAYLVKGQSVTISGTVTQRSYKDKEGVERTATEIRVADVALQGGKREGAQAPAPQRKASAPAGDFDDGSDIPF